MSATPKDGGPAFPHEIDRWCGTGMTLRDFFAAAALSGICANPKESCVESNDAAATLAYQVADVMLSEREKGGAA